MASLSSPLRQPRELHKRTVNRLSHATAAGWSGCTGGYLELACVDAIYFAISKRQRQRLLLHEQLSQFRFDSVADGVAFGRREPMQNEFVDMQLDRRLRVESSSFAKFTADR